MLLNIRAPAICVGATVSASSSKLGISVDWTPDTLGEVAYYEVWRSLSNDRNTATLLASLSGDNYIDQAVVVATTYYYWIKAFPINQYSDVVWIPATTTTTASASPSAIFGIDLQVGQVVEDHLSTALSQRINDIETRGHVTQAALGYIDEQLQKQVNERIDEIAATANGIAALQQHATSNEAKILAEESARLTADAAEVTARQTLSAVLTGVNDPTGLTINDLSAGLLHEERQARATAVEAIATDVELLRAVVGDSQALIYSELETRATETEAVASRISLLTSKIATAEANYLEEVDVRASADSALSSSITSLTASVNSVSAAVTTEEQARIDGDSSLAQQISLLTAGVAAGFDPAQMWYFDSTVDGWTATGTTLSQAGGWLTMGAMTANAVISQASDFAALSGSQYPVIQARIKRVAGSGWTGKAEYKIQGAGSFSTNNEIVSTDPVPAVNDVAVVSWDMTSLTTGGSDWVTHNIVNIKLTLGATSADKFEIDWIGIGRNAPGASMAGLLSEQTARQNGDNALSSSLTSLTATVGNKNTVFRQSTTPTAFAVGDLWYDAANNNQPKRWNGSIWENTADTRVAQVQADLVTEQTTRASADTALSNSITTLTASLGTTNASLSVEQTTRATQDEALSTQIELLKASVGESSAKILDLDSAIATANSSFAESTKVLQSSLNGNTASIRVHAETINGLSASWTATIDNNGYTSGFGLASEIIDGIPRSSAIFRADRFAIVSAANPRNVIGAGNLARTSTTATLNFTGIGSTLAAGEYFEIRGVTVQPGDATNDYPGGWNGIWKVVTSSANSITFSVPSHLATPAVTSTQMDWTKVISPFIVTTTTDAFGNPPGAYINTAFVAKATIDFAQISDTLQSTNYNGTSHTGWRISKAGTIEAQGITIYGTGGTVLLNSGGSFWSNTQGKPANLSILTGSEAIQNSLISISSNGTLSGGGGGQVTIGGLGYSGDLNATNGAPAGTLVAGTSASTVASNAANGQTAFSGTTKYRTAGAPSANPSPTGITVTNNSNGSCNIRLDWAAYTQGTNQADFLMLFWNKTSVAPTVNDGAITFNVNTASASYYIFEGVNPADTYSFGIAAARRTENGLEIGAIQAPASAPDWLGVTGGTPNFTANINGATASVVVTNASNGATAFTGTTNFRNSVAPSNNAVIGAKTQSATADGNIVVNVPYTYTQGAVAADQLFIYVREGGGTVVSSDPCMATNAASGSINFVLKPQTTYTFGIQAVRRVDAGLAGTAIATSSAITTNQANYTANVAGQSAATIASATVNFNARNDRNATAITAPTVAGDGTAVDHSINTDGTSNISFEWNWTGTNSDIDGFAVYVYQSTSNAAYTFGGAPLVAGEVEQIYFVDSVKRAFILYGVPSDKYYTFGVRAYRQVDPDIAASRIIQTSIVKSVVTAENPYQPSASVTFGGDVTGTINGTSSGTVVTNSANGATAFTGTAKYRTTGAPTNNPSPTGLTVTSNSNGTANIRLDWAAYTQGAKQADFLMIFWRRDTTTPTAPTINDNSIAVPVNTLASYYTFEGVFPDDLYSFGIAAARRTENGVEVGAIQAPTTTPDWLGVTAGTPNFTANVNGTSAATVVSNASSAFTGTTNYRNAVAPTNNAAFGTITQTATADGNIVVNIPYTYTQGAVRADQIYVFYRQGGGTVTVADPCWATSAVTGSVNLTLKPQTTYTFGLQAVRRVESGIIGTSILTSASLTTVQGNLTVNVNNIAASNVNNWAFLNNVPDATLYSSDAASSLGFNPTFSAWSGVYPDGWSVWSTPTVTKETTDIRLGKNSIKFTQAAGVQGGVQKLVMWSNTPADNLYVSDVYVSGTFDAKVLSYTSGGAPGLLIDLITTADLTANPTSYRRTIASIPDATKTGKWQRVSFTAGVVEGEKIYGIRVFVMGSWSGMPGGTFAGSVLFDNFQFEFRDQIDSTNIGTFIKNLSVDTLQIAGHAVGAPYTANGAAFGPFDANTYYEVCRTANIAPPPGGRISGAGGMIVTYFSYVDGATLNSAKTWSYRFTYSTDGGSTWFENGFPGAIHGKVKSPANGIVSSCGVDFYVPPLSGNVMARLEIKVDAATSIDATVIADIVVQDGYR